MFIPCLNPVTLITGCYCQCKPNIHISWRKENSCQFPLTVHLLVAMWLLVSGENMFSIRNNNFFSCNKPQYLHYVPLINRVRGKTCRILGCFFFFIIIRYFHYEWPVASLASCTRVRNSLHTASVYFTFGFIINPDSAVHRKFIDVPAKICNTLKSYLHLVSTVGWYDVYMYLTEKVYSQK